MHATSFQQKTATAGAWSAILTCFSVTALGTTITTITITAAILLWFASLKCTEYPNIVKRYPFTLISTFLFLYMGFTLLWSDHLSEGTSIWKKYREFILLPIFLTYFSQHKFKQYGIISLYTGMFFTLIISFLVFYDLFPSPPRHHKLINHIFTGILISFFAYWSLLLAIEHKKYRLLFILLYASAFFCIFVIREGRTGYFLFITLSSLLVVQTWRWKGLLTLALLSLPFLCYIIFVLIDFESINGLPLTAYNLDYFAKIDIRFEYYINTFRIILNNYFFGVGIGDFSSTYLTISSTHENFWGPTVNVHNEFLMITVQTGVIGLIAFLLFFVSLFKESLKFTPVQSKLTMASTITISVSCLFNSSFLDNNDGILFMILISLFFSCPKSTDSTRII